MRYQGGLPFMRDKEYFDTLCNTADGVFIVDGEKRILRWNKGAEAILGHSEADVLNRECYRVVTGKSRADKALCNQSCKIHSNALSGTPQENFDMLVQGKDNKPLWMNISVLSPTDGEEPFLAHIVRNVTQEKTKLLAIEQFLAYLKTHDLLAKEISGSKPAPKNAVAAKLASTEKAAASLSDREIEVLTLLAEGLSTKTMAQKLSISHFTARNHIQNILAKLDLHSKAQAVSYAFKRGIL
jgi:PAS domain S-box-containing protein